MRKLGAFLFVLAVVTACGKPAGGPPLTTTDYKIYEQVATPQDGQSIAVIDTRTQGVERKLPAGTLSSDLRHLYAVSSNTLKDIDPQTGSTMHSLHLPRAYYLPVTTIGGAYGGLSPNGEWLALQAWDPVGSSLPSSSHFLLLSTRFNSSAVRVDLDGWFEFDALSNDGNRLYLVEYLSRGVYRVRQYQVLSNMLNPTVVVDKTDPKDSMTGQRLMAVPSPDGTWLYSVYTREKDGPFIHALNLDGPFALCIDLPGSGYAANPDEFRWSLVLDKGGSRLYAANAALGMVDDVDASRAAVARSAHIESGSSTASLIQTVEAKEVGGNVSVLSPDGRTIVTAGSTGLAWIDTSTLRRDRQALTDWQVWGLGLTPDGKILYAANDSGQLAEVSLASGRTGSMFDPGAGYPIAILGITGGSS